MPINFEVAATNCELAREILDAGIQDYVGNLANESEYLYTCIENIKPSLSAWQIFLAIYIALLIPAFICWVVLHRKGASADQLIILGVLSLLMPAIGPIIMLLSLDQKAVALGVAMEAGPGLLIERRRDADDQY